MFCSSIFDCVKNTTVIQPTGNTSVCPEHSTTTRTRYATAGEDIKDKNKSHTHTQTHIQRLNNMPCSKKEAQQYKVQFKDLQIKSK